MKKLYIILLAVTSLMLSAQNKDTQSADRLFNRFEYANAANAYLKLIEKGKANEYVYKQLADSYYKVFNVAEASKWYAKAVSKKQDAETYYRYAQMLKAEGKYEEADKQMQLFAGMAPKDQRAEVFKQNPNYLPKLNKKEKLFDIKEIDINSDKSDFGAVLSDDNTLYFASARNTTRKTAGWNGQPFLDLYSAVYNSDGTFSEPTAVEKINSKYHDGPATISTDGNTLYFASESFKKGLFSKSKANKLKLGQINIFKAVKVGEKWGKITALPFNSKNYSTSNPCLSSDGKTLYFSSDMPGSMGGVDIWKVTVNADGSYGTPKNLGKKINTKGNESFPFITSDNKLYFSSDARQGFGGMDVYMIDLNKGTDAMNVGKPVNSERDDFAFSFNTAKNVGFVSSNRTGEDNIYMVTPPVEEEINNDKEDLFADNENVVPKEKEIPEEKEKVVVENQDKTPVKEQSADGDLPVNKSKEITKNVKAVLDTKEVSENAVSKEDVILNDIYFEYNKSNISQKSVAELDRLIQIMMDNPEMIVMVKAHTDNRGSDEYNMGLSNRRAKATVQYVISRGISKDRIYGKGFGESEPKIYCGDDCTKAEHAKNRRSEFIIVKK